SAQMPHPVNLPGYPRDTGNADDQECQRDGNLDLRSLKGRHFWKQRSPAVVDTAIRCFEEAIALDPDYALAYAGLADCYAILHVYGWTSTEHSQPRALDAVNKALALDPNLPEAHF